VLNNLDQVTIGHWLVYCIVECILLFVGVYYRSIPECDRPKDGRIDIEKYPPSLGLTVEFCAGIVDKNKALEEIAVDEVREECGYEVKVSDMQKVISCR